MMLANVMRETNAKLSGIPVEKDESHNQSLPATKIKAKPTITSSKSNKTTTIKQAQKKRVKRNICIPKIPRKTLTVSTSTTTLKHPKKLSHLQHQLDTFQSL
jgi:hypothetical protein